jgi:hypothetical protein
MLDDDILRCPHSSKMDLISGLTRMMDILEEMCSLTDSVSELFGQRFYVQSLNM